MKERLIELLNDMQDKGYVEAKNEDGVSCHVSNEKLADAILADGWMRPPCKVGDKVYRIVKMSTGVTNKHKVLYKDGKITGIITPCEPTIKYFIRCVEVTKNNFFDVCENFGKTVFFTYEETQKALGGVEG